MGKSVSGEKYAKSRLKEGIMIASLEMMTNSDRSWAPGGRGQTGLCK